MTGDDLPSLQYGESEGCAGDGKVDVAARMLHHGTLTKDPADGLHHLPLAVGSLQSGRFAHFTYTFSIEDKNVQYLYILNTG